MIEREEQVGKSPGSGVDPSVQGRGLCNLTPILRFRAGV